MGYPVTLNGRTYTLADFEGQNYVDGLPDAFEDFVTHAGNLYSTTSTTSNSIGLGSKTFTVESSKPYQVGTPLRITDSAAPSTNWMDGIVTAYSGTTLTVDVVSYAGSGTKTSWNINIGGGGTSYTGTLPIAQGGTGATTAAAARTNLDTYSKSEADSRFLNVSGEASDVTMNGNTTIGDSSTDTLTVRATTTFSSVGAGAAAGPFLNLDRNSSTPADNDLIGIVQFQGRDSGDNLTTYASISGKIADVTDATEDGVLLFDVKSAGSGRDALTLSHNEAVFNNGSANYDFRVESDSRTHMLFVDASTNYVGVGESSPTKALHINSNTASDIMRLDNTSGGYTLGYSSNLASIDLASTATIRIRHGSAESVRFGPSATVINESGANQDFRIESDSVTSMFYVDASENEIGIGTNDPNAMLGISQISGKTALRAISDTNEEDVTFRFQGKDGSSTIRYADIVFDADGGNERLQFKAPYNTTSPQLELSSTYGAVFNEGGQDRDFRVESDTNANMLVVDAGANQVVVGSAATVSNHALRVAGSVGGFGGDVADTTSGSSRTLDIPISDLGGGRGTYLATYYSYANGGAQQNGFMCMVNVMTSPDRASGEVISERYATVTSITYSGSNVRIVFTANGAYTHQGGKISLLKLA